MLNYHLCYPFLNRLELRNRGAPSRQESCTFFTCVKVKGVGGEGKKRGRKHHLKLLDGRTKGIKTTSVVAVAVVGFSKEVPYSF